MPTRYPVSVKADAQILKSSIVLPFSKRIVANRLLKSAISEYAATFDVDEPSISGVPTSAHVHMYRKWSAGGFGIVVTGNVIVDGEWLEAAGNLTLQEEIVTSERTAAWRAIVEARKPYAALLIAQLGGVGNCPDLARLQHRFIFASRWLGDVGLDGVQLHAAYGSVLANLLSDRNRTTEACSVLKKIREAVPRALTTGLKVSLDDFTPDVELFLAVLKSVNEMEFDFVEVTLGALDPSIDVHSLRSHVRQVLSRSALFWTSGFRLLSDMVAVVEGGVGDGVGLGRPAAQEFDLAHKLLQQGVQSTAVWPFSDFDLSVAACSTLLSQAGIQSDGSDRTANAGLMDLTDPLTCKQFKDAFTKQQTADERIKIIRGNFGCTV